MMIPIPRTFYLRPDVVTIARELLGKKLCTRFDGIVTAGIIMETEAYEGVTDRASHAYGNRRTARTEVMYRIGGTAYIYLCYGIHSLFNVVTNGEGIPHAVLIRGIEPVEGIQTMLARTGKQKITKAFGSGPGKVSKALGIHYSSTGLDLTRKPADAFEPAIWIEEGNDPADPAKITITPRIGVDYAGEDALRPYRFVLPA
jgi:DNA-3-methyladenine glycosylase